MNLTAIRLRIKDAFYNHHIFQQIVSHVFLYDQYLDSIHEVLHLITRTMVLDKKTDEGLVQFFENRLQQLFLENSKFFLSLFQGQ